MNSSFVLKLDEAFTHRIASKMNGSCVLLTGATGLIGTGILNTLDAISQTTFLDVMVFTNSTSGLNSSYGFKTLNLRHLISDLTSDITKISKRKYDFIIHAGGPAQPMDFMQRRKETYIINSIVTQELLDLLEDDGRFIFLSSSELYTGLVGNSFLESQIGTSLPSHPRACYIEGKRAGEMFVNWGRDEGKKASSLRLSYTYGPGSKAGDYRVINQIIESAIKYHQINLKDSGAAIRTNLYVNDAVSMILSVLLNPLKSVYNISGIKTSSIKEIAEWVALHTNSQLTLPSMDTTQKIYAQENVHLDMSAFAEDFGLPRFTELDEGLRQTIEWQKSNLYIGKF